MRQFYQDSNIKSENREQRIDEVWDFLKRVSGKIIEIKSFEKTKEVFN